MANHFLVHISGQSKSEENYTSSSGSLSTPGYPKHYSHNQFCKWNIAASHGYTIRLEFLHFQLESHELCFYDFVQVSKSMKVDVIRESA